jgi:hypothetical protein
MQTVTPPVTCSLLLCKTPLLLPFSAKMGNFIFLFEESLSVQLIDLGTVELLDLVELMLLNTENF